MFSSRDDVKTFDLVNIESAVSQLCTVERTISDLTVGDRVSCKFRFSDCIILNLYCSNRISSKLTAGYSSRIDLTRCNSKISDFGRCYT